MLAQGSGYLSFEQRGAEVNQLRRIPVWLRRTILVLVPLALTLHLIGVLFAAWYIPAYTSMPECYHLADPSFPAEFTVATSGSDILSLVPLGVNCIYFDPLTHLQISRLGPTTWGPTIDATVTVAALVAFLVIGIIWWLSSRRDAHNALTLPTDSEQALDS